MKKKLKTIILLTAATLLLSACFISIEGGTSYPGDVLTVKGTAIRNPRTGEYEFGSADIKVDFDYITDELVPVDDPQRILSRDKEENVLFTYSDFIPTWIDYESKPKDGYTFSYWSVMPYKEAIKDATYDYEMREIRETLRDINDFLSEKVNYNGKSITARRSPVLRDIPCEYLKYITPEYDPEPVLLALVENPEKGGNGVDTPYSLPQFRNRYRESREISAKLAIKDTWNNDLSWFISELANHYQYLEEVHIECANKEDFYGDITLLKKMKLVELRNMNIHSKTTLENTGTKWIFSKCHFDELEVDTNEPVILEGCTIDSLLTSGYNNIILDGTTIITK